MSWEVGRATADKTEDSLAPCRPQASPSGRPQSARGRPMSAGSGRGPVGDIFAATGSRPTRPGRRALPAELGLAGHRVLTLPSHVDTCDQGEKCCWRWLAHSVLKEASWLKEDLDSVRQEHAQSVGERTKLEHDTEAFAELRGAHAATQRELDSLKAEAAEVRRELAAIRTAHAHKAAREQELERELSRVDEERRRFIEQEAASTRRADEAERELERARHREQELEMKLLSTREAEADAHAEVKEVRAELDHHRKVMEEEEMKRQSRARAMAKREKRGGPGTRLAASGGPWGRSTAAARAAHSSPADHSMAGFKKLL